MQPASEKSIFSLPIMRSFISSYLKKLPLAFIVLLVLFAGALFLFAAVAHEVLSEKEDVVDYDILLFLFSHVVNDRLTSVMKAVTWFASPLFLRLAYGSLFVFYLLRKKLSRAVEILAIGIGASLINNFMKLSFQRSRPTGPLIDPILNFSFPSGHALSGFVFYGLLAFLVWKTNLPKSFRYFIACLLILFSLLIGFSRIYLRVHYPSDVLGGFCIGFAWLLLTLYVFDRLKKKAVKEKYKEVN